MKKPGNPGHEPRDVNVKLIFRVALGLVIAAVIIHLATAWLFKSFAQKYPSPEPPSRIATELPISPPRPELQVNPPADYEKFQAAQEKKLNSYGWVNRQEGVVRIPIKRAMDLILQRGLPYRQPGSKDASGMSPVQMQQQKAAATRP